MEDKDFVAEEVEETAENEIPDADTDETQDLTENESGNTDTSDKSAELEAELEKARNDYIRLFADYDNYRKRTAKEKAESYLNASAKCIENLLPVIDSFSRCMEIECTDENFRNGLNMIFNQLKDFLDKMNVTEIDALGKEFDPNFHNAIQQIADTDYASNHVCEVYQKGYVMGDKLIRPAMVAVAQ